MTDTTEPAKPQGAETDALLAAYNARRYAEAENQAASLLESHPESQLMWKLLGLSLHMQGKNGLPALRRAAELAPGDGEVHYYLGSAQARLGLLADAAESYRRALKVRPAFAEANYSLGNVLMMLGQPYEAMLEYRRAIVCNPDSADAHNNLAAALKELGQLNEALSACRRAMQIRPDFAEAHNTLGSILGEMGQVDQAAVEYRRAIAVNPGFAEAHNNLAGALMKRGHLEEAWSACRRALEVRPDFAEAHRNLGKILLELGQCDAAISSLRKAAELRPNDFEALSTLGEALKEAGLHEEAKSVSSRALLQRHLMAEDYNKRGAALLDSRQIVGAVANFRRAAALKPDYARAHSSLGHALRDLGEMDAARASLNRAAELQPDALHHAIASRLLLPVIPGGSGEIAEWRARYENGIAALMQIPGSLSEPGEKLDSVSFYLAYQNADDRPLMESLRGLFRDRIPGLTTTAPHVPGWRPPAEGGRRIRVGFLSEYFYDHTIGKHYQGFIQQLDRSRFEVVVIHGSKSRADAFRHNLDASADKAIVLPATLKGQQRMVAAEQLDVLFYPDIGMSASAYFLAYARLAPVQATSWGHPDTSGLDTVDYYVSSSTNEPEGADAYYTERLIRLNRLPCFYHRTPAAYIPRLTKAQLGLPESGTLYGCLQSLFKIHPDFDAVLADIAAGDPSGHLILPDGKYSAWNDLLMRRWARTFPILVERVRFVPRMLWGPFLSLMELTDVLLDPIHFGSGNTMYDAMLSGTPTVTWPGRFARGRNVSAAYRQMAMAGAPVASCLEDYAQLALALGRDPGRRRALREASLQAAVRDLFEDFRAVRDLEAFLEAAVGCAANGTRLPAGWRPAI